MKKIIPLLLMLFSLSSFASHLGGGDIQYRYIGDSTGIAHHYEITLRIYRSCEPGAATSVCSVVKVVSGCFADQTINMQQVMNPGDPLGEFNPPTYEDCVVPGSVKCLKVRLFKGTVILPGKCSDFVFYWNCFARPPGIDNIQQPSNAQGFYFEATLNNFLGNNSSPFFVSEPARAFCVNQNFNWKQSVVEPDGDSIFFKLVDPRDNAPLGAPIPFAPGYSVLQPVRTNPAGTFNLNPFTGNLNFTPGFVETDVIALLALEYRYDSLLNIWQNIGSSNRELVAAIDAVCSPEAQMGVVIDTTYPGTYYDPINKLYTIDYKCLDSAVIIHFLNKLDCSTISFDGTDFRLTSPDSQPIAIKEAISFCDVNNESKSILLKLYEPLATNGDYNLYSKNGNDGNTLLNKCGFPLMEFDTIQLRVKDCNLIQIAIKNVTIVEDNHPRIEWLLDTNTFETYLFEKMRILRKDPGASTFQHVGNVLNPFKTFFNDVQINGVMVDLDAYEYKIQMVYNGKDLPPTRFITSILLTSTGTSCDTIPLEWNAYNGWANNKYKVQYALANGSGNLIWIDHQNSASGANPTTNTKYVLRSELAAGNYRIRVVSEGPNGGYASHSNWIDCGVGKPPATKPDTVIVPNVFTPNGDGVNDALLIHGIETFDNQRAVNIYNRWGEVVYTTQMYSNSIPFTGKSNIGAELADGVYFIVVKLYDADSNTSFSYSGALTLIRNK